MLTKPSWWVGTSGIVDPFVSYPIELDHSGRELIALSRCPIILTTRLAH